MGNIYLKLLKPPDEMKVGIEYTFRFEITTTKPKGEYVELRKERSYHIQVCGIGNNWTDGNLIFPFDYDEEEIRIKIKPVQPIFFRKVFLEFYIKRREEIYDNFLKEITIIDTEVGSASISNEYKEIKKVNLKFAVEKLSNNQGILTVSRNGDMIQLYGVSGSGKTGSIPMNIANPQKIAIESYVEGDTFYQDLYGLGKNLYHEMDPSISRWMALLCNQRDPWLLVCDYTDMETPWELIYMDNDQCRGFWGELLAISRWQRVAKEGEEVFPEIFCKSSQGNLVSYILDEKTFKWSALEEIEAIKKCGGISIETKSKLLEFLNGNRADIAILHMACHGTFDTGNPQNAAIDFMSALSLSAHEMQLIAHSQPVIFINACHSGRKNQLGWAVNGVNIPFFRKGAKGFIGVMGRVRLKAAPVIASRLLAEMHKENPLPIAEILRRIRKEAVENAKKAATEENKKAFRDAFMYIFYGSPLKVVSIKSFKDQVEK